MPLYSNYGRLVCLWLNISYCLDTAVIMINKGLLVKYATNNLMKLVSNKVNSMILETKMCL